MTRTTTHVGAQWLTALSILAAVSGFTLAPARADGQTASISGQGTAAAVTTTTSAQQFAIAALPSSGGMADSEETSAAVPNTLTASGLVSIATGQIDQALVSATTSAEAANVTILNGLITAQAVLAVATSYANGVAAATEAQGSTLLGLVVNGVSYSDVALTPNTQVVLPGVGYVVFNEQISGGDGVHNATLTVNMIHVYLTDPATGTPVGDIVVGAARTAASL